MLRRLHQDQPDSFAFARTAAIGLLACFVGAALVAGPAFADGHQPSLSELITDTLGYVQVREGVVILEGEAMGSFICKIDVSDAAFDAYLKNGNLGGIDADYACIPVEEFEK